MAEFVRGRILAAKVGVVMAFAGLLGGTGAAASKLLTSRDIKDHSLLYKDLKRGQAADPADARAVFGWWEKRGGTLDEISTWYGENKSALNAAAAEFTGGVFQGQLGALSQKISDLGTASDTKYLHKADTAANAEKLGGQTPEHFVQGPGAVYAGTAAAPLTGGQEADVLSIPDLKVSGSVVDQQQTSFTLLNTSDTVMSWSWTADGKTHTGTTAPGKSFVITLSQTEGSVVGLFVCDFEPNEATTFTLSALPTQDNATLELAGQAIVAG